MTQRLEINHDTEPVRLFQSNFLEFFTHIHPAVVLAIFLPLVGWLMLLGARQAEAAGNWLPIPAGFLLGVWLWTLTEYLGHRFIFHYHPKSERGKQMIFLFHGIHHYQPQCKTRLVMPPAVSVPMSIVFYLLFSLVFRNLLGAPGWFHPTYAGFLLGYLAYDMIHYATHHFRMRSGVLKFLKRYHMQHHYKTPELRFGVSSPLWDRVFGTFPAA